MSEDNLSLTAPNETTDLGKKIREARKEARLSQGELGKRLALTMGRHLHFSQAAISDIERGVAPVSDETAKKLAEILGKPLSYFLGNGLDHERLSTRSTSRYIFQQWKKAVGLPLDFPTLRPLADTELDLAQKFYAGFAHQARIEEILDRAAAPLAVVLVNRGHGCTTLSRYVFQETRKTSIRTRLIPIRLTLDDMYTERQPLQALEKAMRRGIVERLIWQSWDRVLDPGAYAALLGAVGLIGVSFEEHLIQLDAALRGTNGSPNWDEVKCLAPRLAAPIDTLLADLSQLHSIQVSLQMDLSSSVAYKNPNTYEEMLAGVQKTLKQLHERDSRKHIPTFPAVLNELYFVSPQGYKTLNFTLQRPYTIIEDPIEYPSYRQVDMFAILSYHYPPQGQNGIPRSEVLASVVDPSLLDGLVRPGMPLVESVRLFEERLLAQMSGWETVTYQLKSKRRQA